MTRGAWLVLPLLAASCGDAAPPVRLGAAEGRTLTYVAERIDQWPDEKYGYGGTLRTEVTYRTRCIDAVPDKRGTYDVRIVSVVIDAPERFGVVLDTVTPEPEAGDEFGAEEIVRELLERDGRITLDTRGVPFEDPEVDQGMRDRLTAWGAGYDGMANPAMLLLDEVLDGPRMVAQWNRAVSLLLPRSPRPPDGETWTVVAPPFDSPAGRLVAELACTFHAIDDTHGRVEAAGSLRVESAEGAPLGLQAGTMQVVLDVDRYAGTVTRYHETMSLTFTRPEGTEMPVSWNRILTLVD